MQRFGKRDQNVFQEFAHDRERLHRIAGQIRQAVGNEELVDQLYQIQDEEDLTPLWQVQEGKVLYKLHKLRERDQSIIHEKKELAFQEMGRLLCEACAFDFERTYGKLGHRFIECHHTTPVVLLPFFIQPPKPLPQQPAHPGPGTAAGRGRRRVPRRA